MPIPILGYALFKGVSESALLQTATRVLPVLPVLFVLWALKTYLQGARNLSERNLHGKVVIATGGTSGIGAEVVRGLATRGAQVVILTQHELGDPFLVDFIQDVRKRSNNELVTAEQVDLSSLHSIRTFATKWIDNAPPRRLDMVVLCGNVTLPPGSRLQSTQDGFELTWALNYLANFHLLSILSPAIRAQPPDRDVRVLVGTCVSYLAGELPKITQAKTANKVEKSDEKQEDGKPARVSSRFSASSAYASSKLALMTFSHAFQQHLSAYKRPDGQPNNARVILVDPGFTRTPGMHRYLTWGSLFGLLLYVIFYPFWWLVLKSPDMGAQSFLHAAMESEYARGSDTVMIKECRQITATRPELTDEEAQKSLWKQSETSVEQAERRGATARAKRKAESNRAASATGASTNESS